MLNSWFVLLNQIIFCRINIRIIKIPTVSFIRGSDRRPLKARLNASPPSPPQFTSEIHPIIYHESKSTRSQYIRIRLQKNSSKHQFQEISAHPFFNKINKICLNGNLFQRMCGCVPTRIVSFHFLFLVMVLVFRICGY